MLKIKKEKLKLKYLKRFGFARNERGEFYHEERYMNDFYIYKDGDISIDECGWDINELKDLLFDLIQAGLVEKVENRRGIERFIIRPPSSRTR